MQRQRGELVPIGEIISGLDEPVKKTLQLSPQAYHHRRVASSEDSLPAPALARLRDRTPWLAVAADRGGAGRGLRGSRHRPPTPAFAGA